MSDSAVSSFPMPEFSLWKKIGKDQRIPMTFDLEITARCNNNCRHCYINLPAGDTVAKEAELSFDEIKKIVDDAVSLGAIWCLITGGEPFLREDFSDIYLYARRKGLLVSVFTNGTLITEEHISLFKQCPPRSLEITVYGVTEDTYERVTRRTGTFGAFMRGLDLLFDNGIKVELKAMAMRSNVHEMQEIAQFCRERTKSVSRFDPLLHLRYDGDPVRNEEIKSERLSPAEIVAAEWADEDRAEALERECDRLIRQESPSTVHNHLFRCGAGKKTFSVGYDGTFRLCAALWHKDCTYDLREGDLADAWSNFVPKVLGIHSDKREFVNNCAACPIISLCMWCPGHAYLETGELDAYVNGFCRVAHARADALTEATTEK